MTKPIKTRCGCESGFCAHTRADRSCTRNADGPRMDMVGRICKSCADVVRGSGGAHYLHEWDEPTTGRGRP